MLHAFGDAWRGIRPEDELWVPSIKHPELVEISSYGRVRRRSNRVVMAPVLSMRKHTTTFRRHPHGHIQAWFSKKNGAPLNTADPNSPYNLKRFPSREVVRLDVGYEVLQCHAQPNHELKAKHAFRRRDESDPINIHISNLYWHRVTSSVPREELVKRGKHAQACLQQQREARRIEKAAEKWADGGT